jgi:bleomycin hydrolase
LITQRIKFLLTLVIISFSSIIFAQEEEKDIHEFNMIYEVATTPVKSQGRSGTCWVFALTSFVETELIRMNKGEHDLSEMYFVRRKLLPMAEKHIRYHGNSNFGQGGQGHDVLNSIRDYGIVPEEVYSGMNIGEDVHNHGELDAVIQGMLKGIIKKQGGKLTPRWKEAVVSVLNVYLGTPPEEFTYNEQKYTPESFANGLGFNPDDYIEITSYIHHPFYEKFKIELPDNWSGADYYNIPIDELIEVIDYALKNGYSVAWDGDSGRDHFYRKECYAVIPVDDSPEEVTEPEEEKVITQEMRQETFDNFETTDDHLMHLTGIAENQNGTKFYYTKNSWGTKDRKYDGFWYMSESYVRLKTIAILIHKDAILALIKNKLGL